MNMQRLGLILSSALCLLSLGSCASEHYLNYSEVNRWGKEHVARVTLIGDSLQYIGTAFYMRRDSTSWLAPERLITVPTPHVEKVIFDKPLFTSFMHVVRSVLWGGALFFTTAAVSRSGPASILAFIGGFFLTPHLDQENVFLFYPEPISRQ